ncbi:LCP family protein [Gryllotalpicola daejeonensis]|uniref:LCP family protein n=1 Tax=Gryllotalpicola daejeonensis TaxID=993087 RepID=A0ABP7ZF70_9MICO
MLLLGGGYVVYNYFHFVGSVHKVDGALPDAGKAKTSSGADENILIIGTDQRPANMTAAQYKQLSTTPDGGGINTDTMILLHIPADGSSATLVSFPRDSYVDIPGYSKNKINAAYADGYQSTTGTADQKNAAGVRVLASTITQLTGLPIDHYVKVNLIGFYNIANALGPVDVCLKNPVNDHYSGAHFPAGPQKLNATQALQFVRQRHGLPNGDFDRAVRQQYFLTVEAQQVLSAGTLLNPVKLNTVIGAIGRSLETDSGLNMIQLAGKLKNLQASGIRSATIPLANPRTSTQEIGGLPLDVDNVDYDAMPDFIDSITGRPTTAQRIAKAAAAAPSAVTVDVLNGAGTAHGSSDAAAVLATAGFHTGAPADAPQTQHTTTIYVPAGDEAQAKALLPYLPRAALVGTTTYKQLTIVLGTDGMTPTAPSQPSGVTTPTTAPSTAPTAAPTPTSTPATNAYNAATCID